jgi:hypothetical protein
VLLILRPLLYVLLIRRYGLRSWLPWLLSLALDATGMTVLYSTTILPSYKVGNHLRPAATMSKLEKNEVIHHIFLCILMSFPLQYQSRQLVRLSWYVAIISGWTSMRWRLSGIFLLCLLGEIWFPGYFELKQVGLKLQVCFVLLGWCSSWEGKCYGHFIWWGVPSSIATHGMLTGQSSSLIEVWMNHLRSDLFMLGLALAGND